jgi:hypothetical protein
MKVIFHIGMGKTGTSSIQTALRQNQKVLQEHNACYLGMWFDFIDPKYTNIFGTDNFARETPEIMRANADRFISFIENKGHDLYILSNEELFGHAENIKDFFSILIEKGVDISILAYFRPPHDWLPSAFTQWNIYHKQQKGPVQTFRQRAPKLLGIYAAARILHGHLPDHFEARLFDKSVDVISDFASVLNIPLVPPATRTLERTTDAETVLRALFNDRYKDPVLPEAFTNVVMRGHWSLPRTLDDMIDRVLEFDGLDEIVADQAGLFTYIKDEIGLDLRTDTPSRPPKEIDRDAIYKKILDYIIFIALEQSAQIRTLKKDLEDLKNEIRADH